MSKIIQITAVVKKLPTNGNQIEQVYGLSEDNKVLRWDWKSGSFLPYQQDEDDED